MSLSIAGAILIAAPVAIFVVWKRNKLLDPLFVSVSLLGVSIPEFWLAMLLALSFGVAIPIFPVAEYVPISESFTLWLYHLILPTIVLVMVEVGLIARMLRDGMLESINQDYTRTARAKGVRESVVVFRNVFTNVLIQIMIFILSLLLEVFSYYILINLLFAIH